MLLIGLELGRSWGGGVVKDGWTVDSRTGPTSEVLL